MGQSKTCLEHSGLQFPTRVSAFWSLNRGNFETRRCPGAIRLLGRAAYPPIWTSASAKRRNRNNIPTGQHMKDVNWPLSVSSSYPSGQHHFSKTTFDPAGHLKVLPSQAAFPAIPGWRLRFNSAGPTLMLATDAASEMRVVMRTSMLTLLVLVWNCSD